MNFAGPFDSKLSHDSPVSLGGERFAFDSKPGFVQHHASDSHVVIPDAHLLFSGDYTRIGSDLIISANGQKFVVGNYFKGEARPALTTKDGATLSGHIVDALTGHVHYAQATAAPAAGEVIGHVQKLSGSASVIRNGVSVELQIGAAVQKGDVVQTGSDSTLGMTFIDGSAFGMTSNARMVLNEMIFDPNGSSNSSLMSLVQGTVTFVAGQTAKNGNMRVETPVATMGIRGTAVLVEIAANDGPTKFSVLVEPDGTTGSFNLYDKVSGQLIGTVSQAGQVTFVSSLGIGQPPTAIEQLKTLADQQAEKALIQQVFQLYFPNYNPDDSNPKMPKFGFSSSGNNLAEILFTTHSSNTQTFLTQIELRFAVTDPLTGITTYQNKIFYNTKAQFSASSILSEQAFDSTVESFKISDLVHIDDPDIGNAPFYDTATPFVAGSAIIKSAVSTNPNLSADFLSQFLHIDQNTGVISFDRLGFNFLGEGESVTFMIQVTSQSGPDVAHVIIPVTITGDNDVPNDNGVPNGAPTIVLSLSDILGAVKEDTPVGVSSLAANGTITFRDVDLSDGHQAAVVFTSSTSGSTLDPISNPSLPSFDPGDELGIFTIDPAVVEDETDTINTGTIGWHFELNDNDPTLQSLAEGQTITQVYTITITDEYGAFVTQDVTITITGTNDAPVLSADTTPVHQADEKLDTTDALPTVVDTASGSLTFSDIDLSDTHLASAALHPGASSVVWSGGSYSGIPQATRDALANAVTASVSESNTDTDNQGSVGWEFKLPDHLFDFLAHGETLTLIYDVTVTDNNGISSTQQVTVQIGAANDQPVISVIDNGAAVKEDVDPVGVVLKDTGSVTFTDTDLTDTHTAHVAYNNDADGSAGVSPALALALATALTVPASALAAGDHDFNWDFALDTNLIQYLAEGETVTATYTITVKDSTNNTSAGQTVTVTITGTNDLPTISVTNPATGIEGNTGTPDVAVVTVADHVSITDVDASDVHVRYVADTLAFDAGGSSGTPPVGGVLADLFTLNETDGTISYDRAAFDYLAADEHVSATFTFDASSGPDTVQKSITVTIDGVNDAPVAVADIITPVGDEWVFNPGNGHYYRFVSLTHDHTVNWETAKALAEADGGYLATVTSAEEQAFIYSLTNGDATWLGGEGSTANDASTWTWETGPEQNVQFTYTNWHSGEPNGGVTYPSVLLISADGTWKNVPKNSGASDSGYSYIEEWGGLPGQLVFREDTDTTLTTTQLLANDTDIDTAHGSLSIVGFDGTTALTGTTVHGGTVSLSDGIINYHPAADYYGADSFTYTLSDGSLTSTGTVSFNVAAVNDAPVLNGDNVSVLEIGDGGVTYPDGTTKVFGISLSDPDETGSLTVSAESGNGIVAGYGTVTTSTGAPLSSNYSIADFNDLFSLTNGITYTPTSASPDGNDMVTLTVSDSHGLSDTLHFVFQQNGTGGATLTGTTGKDLIFSTGDDDTLTGQAGQDNFVFAPASGNDTITDFSAGADKIDLKALTGMDASALTTLLDTADHVGTGGADLLLHLNGTTDTLLLKGVATLNASDFILHA